MKQVFILLSEEDVILRVYQNKERAERDLELLELVADTKLYSIVIKEVIDGDEDEKTTFPVIDDYFSQPKKKWDDYTYPNREYFPPYPTPYLSCTVGTPDKHYDLDMDNFEIGAHPPAYKFSTGKDIY